MPGSIASIILGLDYQAVWFWIQACRLLSPSSLVSKVVVESPEIKSFDDVVVYYKEPIVDERGEVCFVDCYQIKFHVDHAGVLGYRDLTDPGFIGAAKFSFLQKLHAVQNQYAPDGRGARFYLVSPWPIDPSDPLARLVSNQGGEIRLATLSDKTMRGVREFWKGHLNVDEEGLERMLRTLRIHVATDLNRERARLNDAMAAVGLIPAKESYAVRPYEDLMRKCLEQGIHEYTKESLLGICSREGLWSGQTQPEDTQPMRLGIRSFLRWAEYLEDETDHTICFLRYFDNRLIRDHRLWSEAIYPEMNEFLHQHIRRGRPYHLRMDAHSSIAFAAGYCLSKSGSDVAPVQSSASGAQVWRQGESSAPLLMPDWEHTVFDCPGDGNDVALAVSVTHEITNDVKGYVNSNLPKVRRMVACSLGEHVGGNSIRNAGHAVSLARRLQKWLHANRTDVERGHTMHLFVSAPNGFLFFLGKLAMDFGRVWLYEYDFGSGNPTAYFPSFTFPPVAQSMEG